MIKIAKKLINFIKITNIMFKDYIKCIKYCGFPYVKKDKIDWKILLIAHSLEKGLSISKSRIEFGVEKACILKELLIKYDNKNTYVYKEGRNVLYAYIEFRKDNKLDYERFLLNDKRVNYNDGGFKILNKKNVKCNPEDFNKLCLKRHSVRNFSNKYVNISDVRAAVATALFSPSACNRQMIKVYTTNDMNQNGKIAQLIPGNAGFKNENCRYLILTADTKAFDYYEINQWYLNGGIFVSYLQLAFTSNNIGSCIYQWPKIKTNDIKMRKILNIADNEEILTILAVGYYKENFTVLKAKRKDVNDILIERN